jgi:hypothetical protein
MKIFFSTIYSPVEVIRADGWFNVDVKTTNKWSRLIFNKRLKMARFLAKHIGIVRTD